MSVTDQILDRLTATEDQAKPGESAHGSWLAALGLNSFVSIDVETTGLDPELDELIEVAAVKFVDGVVSERFSTFLAIDRPLPAFITQMTGISDADLRGAPRLSDVSSELERLLNDCVIVGQNPEFDIDFLKAGLSRHRHNSEALATALTGNPRLDTAMLARVFWPELRGFSLGALCRHFEVELSRAHRALDDARATGQLLTRIVESLPAKVWPSLATQLYKLIGGSSHRSRFFFAALQAIVASAPHTEPGATDTSPEADQTEPIAASIADILGKGGSFERAFSHFAHRTVQLDMAQATAHALEHDEFLLVEAPTGVGKSLAYLVPALQWASESSDRRRQIVVSSHTRTLQDQLQKKDVEELRKALDRPVSTAVLKGRNNYLCLRRFRQLLREAGERLSDNDRIQLMPLVTWAEKTVNGDISEISGFRPRNQPYLWSLVCSDSAACAGNACAAARGDFYRAALDRAQKARVLFVNHALLMTDPSRFAPSMTCDRALIMDEAHHIERAAVSAFTVELSQPVLRNALIRLADERSNRGLVTRLRKLGTEDVLRPLATLEGLLSGAYDMVRATIASVAEAALASFPNQNRNLKTRFRTDDNLHSRLRDELLPLLLRWREIAGAVRSVESALNGPGAVESIPTDIRLEWRSALEQIEIAEATITAFTDDESTNLVRWIEAGRGRNNSWSVLYAAPVDVSQSLARKLWPAFHAAIFTSATLTSAGSFDYFAGTTGLTTLERERRIERRMNSPYRLADQMRCYVPTFVPEPRQGDSAYMTALIQTVTRLLHDVPVGTLVLCTSLEQVDAISTACGPAARQAGRPLLVHHSGSSSSEIIQEFRAAKRGILIGAASLWEGIDVMGEALEMLIVTRLPFDVPTDPWVAARSEALQSAGRDAFNEFSIPVVTLRLKQGLGRLIRHANDRGIAIVADSRLHKSGYGRRIAHSLIPAPQPVTAEDDLVRLSREFLLFDKQI